MLEYNVQDRLTIDQILNHNWFKDTPKQEDVTIFNKSERILMIKEFFYNEDPELW